MESNIYDTIAQRTQGDIYIGVVGPVRTGKSTFIKMLTMFSNPLAGILVGILFTAVLQSASATVGVLQALSVTGLLTFASAFPIVLFRLPWVSVSARHVRCFSLPSEPIRTVSVLP